MLLSLSNVSIFTEYALVNQTGPGFKNCTNGKVGMSQTFGPGEVNQACIFDKNLLGPCGQSPYGYDIGKPCILVKVNKVRM